MKKGLIMLSLVVTFFALNALSASAVTGGMVKVGLRYGSSAMFSANLENEEGWGYAFGYYNDEREFIPLGETEETAISMTAAGPIYMNQSGTYSVSVPSGGFWVLGPYHIQLDERFSSFAQAASWANQVGGYPAYLSGSYVVRVGGYESRGDAEHALSGLDTGGSVVESSSTGVLVTETRTTNILFEFDCQGALNLGVQPNGQGAEAVTWFRGSQYLGGFEYARVTGGDLNVINVVDLEQYVRSVVPYEMPGTWDVEALKAQAVCARTYACLTTKHLSSYGFDVCSTTDCQVYSGVGTGSNGPTSATEQAVAETAGECLYYNGKLAEAYYHSSDGGATEDAANVWGGDVPYLQGKTDPYEAMTSIPNYEYTVTYTWEELTWVLQNSGYDIGTVVDAYVSEYTDLGNVYAVTFVDSGGKTMTMTGDKARMAFYSTTLGKSVPSLRFTISGGTSGGGSGYAVNSASNTLPSLDGVSVISGDGTVSRLEGDSHSAITASGTSVLTGSKSSGGQSAASPDGITITGTGNGHNVGMSQYGAKAMAEQGYDYIDILKFYFTGITVG